MSADAAAASFYDDLAPFYHLIYPDWEASVQRQAAALDALLRQRWGERPLKILDIACGIGTQALGLAALGHYLTASDLSPAAVARARCEAEKRALTIPFSVADMRRSQEHHAGPFDVVLAADNAVPHLLSDDELRAAFRSFHACLRPGGGCLLTVRDYEREERSGIHVKPYGVRTEGGVRYVVFQVWQFDGPHYDLAMYFVEDRGAGCVTHVMRSRYYAVTTGRLLELLLEAGFASAERLDGCFYQPVLLAKRADEAEAGHSSKDSGIKTTEIGGNRKESK